MILRSVLVLAAILVGTGCKHDSSTSNGRVTQNTRALNENERNLRGKNDNAATREREAYESTTSIAISPEEEGKVVRSAEKLAKFDNDWRIARLDDRGNWVDVNDETRKGKDSLHVSAALALKLKPGAEFYYCEHQTTSPVALRECSWKSAKVRAVDNLFQRVQFESKAISYQSWVLIPEADAK